ncbi:two-component regulator propeller domain-containing protein [Paraclostridium benzoelyticum]|uniref:ligand-binding sensor domain-containing protein n=1 Tax=Paraclostridium benzoelyticum TaxID=1629550 RepID=UPI0031CD221B
MKKMNLIKKINIFVLIMIFCGINLDLAYAYNDMSFKNITIEDGLSQSSINTLYQDTNGYMWIGTNDGLNRYNGYDFKVYSYNDKNKNSISNNFIIDVTKDNNRNIWVGTANGLSKINLKNGTINNYLDGYKNGNLSHYNILDVLVTKDNRIIVATSNGLNLYDKENNKFKRILSSEKQLTSQIVNSLTEDEFGNIWIGTDSGLDKYDTSLKNRMGFYKNKGNNSISESSINKVYYEKGNIWLGTSNSGLIKINVSNNEITRYSNNSDNKNSLPGNHINDIMKDSRGNLWICTNQGLAKYNYKTNNFITYSNEIYDKTSLIANDVISIIEDKSGLIWLGTYAGISMFDPDNEIKHYKTNPSDENSINSNLIQGIYEDNEGLLWVGTNSKGINIIDREKNIVRRIDKEHNEFTLSDYSINDITGKDDYIYIATDNGLNVLNKKTKKLKNILKKIILQIIILNHYF